jgi:mannose-6-phosphate isomerase-like protein (cupin superfamily)
MKKQPSLDLTHTYVFLEDGGHAPRIEGSDGFWRELMSGNPASPEAARVANGGGWLTAVYRLEHNTANWEMHPAGDELLVVLSGAVDVVLEDDGSNRIVELREGRCCVVPRGTWHRQVVRSPGRELAITYGKGTQHRPV